MREHEIQYRDKKLFDKMQKNQVTICGAGALGSNLANILTRQGLENLLVIDMDRVEKNNIATQVYSLRDTGQKKVNALKSFIFQNTKVKIDVFDKKLIKGNAKKILRKSDLIVDVFDNWESRQLVKDFADQLTIPCVHAGMSDDGFAEIKWNDSYNIPEQASDQEDICDYPLAANLVHFTTAILSEVIVQFITENVKNNRTITLKDLRLHSE